MHFRCQTVREAHHAGNKKSPAVTKEDALQPILFLLH